MARGRRNAPESTLCESCTIDKFRKCKYVHFGIRIADLETVPVMIKQDGEYIRQEMVVWCPDYEEDTHRAIK